MCDVMQTFAYYGKEAKSVSDDKIIPTVLSETETYGEIAAERRWVRVARTTRIDKISNGNG